MDCGGGVPRRNWEKRLTPHAKPTFSQNTDFHLLGSLIPALRAAPQHPTNMPPIRHYHRRRNPSKYVLLTETFLLTFVKQYE